jgi:hypothetical protein
MVFLDDGAGPSQSSVVGGRLMTQSSSLSRSFTGVLAPRTSRAHCRLSKCLLVAQRVRCRDRWRGFLIESGIQKTASSSRRSIW